MFEWKQFIHLGSMEMTCYMNNKHPVLFSFSTEKLENEYPSFKYISQTYYVAWCMGVLHESADEGDEECKNTLLEARARLFENSYFIQAYSEMILPELDLRVADSVLVLNSSDLVLVREWIEKTNLDIEVIDLSREGLQKYFVKDNFVRSCDSDNCNGVKQIFDLAQGTGALELLETDKIECPLIDDD